VKSVITSGVIATCVCAIMYCVSCALPARPVRAVEGPKTTEIERLFQYFVSLKALPLDALSHEYARQEAAFAQSHSAEDRLRLVLLLSLPDTAFENRLYAFELLQAYLNEPEPHPAGLLDVAVFLMTFMENKTYRSAYDARIHTLKKDRAEKERRSRRQHHQGPDRRRQSQNQNRHGPPPRPSTITPSTITVIPHALNGFIVSWKKMRDKIVTQT